MMHNRRAWGVHVVDTIDELAKKLTEHTWTLCSGFVISGHEQYLFLNDSTCEDGAQEYAIVKRVGNTVMQVESITFSWCDVAAAHRYIDRAIRGEFDGDGWAITTALRIEEGKSHERCPHCA